MAEAPNMGTMPMDLGTNANQGTMRSNTPAGNPRTIIQRPITPAGNRRNEEINAWVQYTNQMMRKRKEINMPSIGSNKVEKLTDDNWFTWREKIESLLHCYELFGHIDGTDPRPVNDADEQRLWDREDYIARTLILINLQGDQITHMSRSKNVHDAWNNLKTVHETRSQSSALLAKRTFYSMRAEDDGLITDHVTEMTKQRNELGNMGCEISEAEFKAVLVMSLPKSWTTWTQSYLGAHADKGDSDKIRGYTSNELIAIILDEYRRRKEAENPEKGYYAKTERSGKKRKVEHTVETKQEYRRKKCAICGRDNHPTEKCRFKGKPKCTSCGKFGHETSACWGNKGPPTPLKKMKERAHQARDPQEDEEMGNVGTAFISNEDRDVKMNENDDGHFSAYTWVADSGTTSHIVNQRNAFKEFKPLSNKRISGIGDTGIDALGRGTIEIITRVNDQNLTVTLKDVLYAPDAINNLFSISRLDENGGRAQIENGQIILRNRADCIMAIGKRIDRLYILNAKTKIVHDDTSATATEVHGTWDEWHRRFGHVGLSGLKRLLQAEMVDGLKVNENVPFQACTACIEAKQAHNPFPKTTINRSTSPGELTHTDVWGPARTTAISGARYYITFIDDCTRRCTVQFMKSKNEATEKVKNYLMHIERQRGKLPKRVRADNGTEYLNKDLTDWCKQKGIEFETTAPYSPSQNGVAERFNRTLIELARAMLIARELPKFLWPAAVTHAAYLRNRSHTHALQGKTPEESWTGTRPNVSHFKEFGAPVWILKEGENLSKLEPKSEKQIFVGFQDGPKAVKYYSAKSRQIKTSRNFCFRDDVTPQIHAHDVPREGEKVPIDTQTSRVNLRRKLSETEPSDIPLRKSSRTKIIHDYEILNDPHPELAELDDPEEEEQISSVIATVYAAFNESGIAPENPKTIAEARKSPEWPEWEKAVLAELEQLKEMNVWELIDRPEGRSPIGNKWVFVKKYNKDGDLTKYKARLVAKGYSQIPGMDYTDTYSPVVRLETIRTILSLAVSQDWEIQQMDVKGAFLNGILKEEVFMDQPQGYEDGTDRLCRLIRTIYGLKQSGREWNYELNKELEAAKFTRLYSDPCAYIRRTGDNIEIITVWVDDLLLFTNDVTVMGKLKLELQTMFDVTDLGDPNKIVGIEINRDRIRGELRISQTRYIESILEKYGLADGNSVSTPLDPKVKFEPITPSTEKGNRSNEYASLIGSLMYAAVATRPDIAYAVYRLASYTANPGLSHWTAAKRVLQYLKGTKSLGITYKAKCANAKNNILTGYSDASFANNDDRTSVSGYTFISSGGAITWGSKKQSVVSLSTTEAEYICLSDAARETTWLRNLFKELGYDQTEATLIYGDNEGSLAIARNPQYHKRTKQFDIRNHYIRDQIKVGRIVLEYLSTVKMTADIFTKALSKAEHEKHLSKLGMTAA
jgi:transposase InsO family protein